MHYLINNIQTDWKEFVAMQFRCSYMQEIDQFLTNHQHLTIYPDKTLIFRCFNFFNINDTRVVIFGQDPYFNVDEANGLCFSVNQEIKSPPTLKNIFKELENDLGIRRTNSELSDWANQGILLINTSLTVFAKQPNSHQKIGWSIFIEKVIDLLNNNTNKIVFVLLGKNAIFLESLIDSKHVIIKTTHPSPLSAYRGFFDSKIFTQINYHLIHKIKW